jgi:glyoxylase-like metal-dependent hydrolase (beta-lactamase superfamily II)
MVNCYIVGVNEGGECLVIDPGSDVSAIARVLDEENLSLSLILLTHGHVDHVGGVRALIDDRGGKVVMHRGDLFLLEGVDDQARMFGLPPVGTPRIDRFVEDGDRIELGELSLDVLHTPGHSPGGVTYRMDDRAFVGDLLFSGSIGRTDLPGGSFEVLVDSVKGKLYPLGDGTRVYPGHGPSTTVGEERLYNPFLQDVYMA